MTVVIHIGRRLPRNWFRRTAAIGAGFISFQSNIWNIIIQSMNIAKRKATASGTIGFVMTAENEFENINYQIEWRKIVIQGTRAQEKEEYDEAMRMYSAMNQVFKKEMPSDENMKACFKTKLLTSEQLDRAYKAGYGSIGDNNLANKLLEMGILTNIELIDDYDGRVM